MLFTGKTGVQTVIISETEAVCAFCRPVLVLTLNEGGISRWGGDSHRGDLDGGLASSSYISLVVRVFWPVRGPAGPSRALLGGDG